MTLKIQHIASLKHARFKCDIRNNRWNNKFLGLCFLAPPWQVNELRQYEKFIWNNSYLYIYIHIYIYIYIYIFIYHIHIHHTFKAVFPSEESARDLRPMRASLFTLRRLYYLNSLLLSIVYLCLSKRNNETSMRVKTPTCQTRNGYLHSGGGWQPSLFSELVQRYSGNEKVICWLAPLTKLI